MIQPNELRIGNWVLGASRGLPQQVTAAMLYQFDKMNIHPIPLTPEILEKARLKDVWIKNSWMVVEDVSGGEHFGWAMKVRNASYTKEIEFAYFKYMHQLQNLIFALTGEELQIEL